MVPLPVDPVLAC